MLALAKSKKIKIIILLVYYYIVSYTRLLPSIISNNFSSGDTNTRIL